jgi:regulator of sigma E protease
MLIYLLATVFVLGVLVLIHELGHFIVAKAVDIKVPRFSIGLGPKLVGFKKGETEYCISAIPFGGYVKMAGEASGEFIEGGGDEESVVEIEPSPRDFDQKPIWARFIVVSAGSVTNYLWGFLLLFFLAIYQGVPYLPVSAIGELKWGEGGPLEELSDLTEGDKIVKVSGIEVKYWDEVVNLILDESVPLSLTWKDTAGEIHEARISSTDPVMRERVVEALEPAIPAKVGKIQKDSPADKAGFLVGDEILAIQGIQIGDFSDAVHIISMNPETELEVLVLREGSYVNLKVTPDSEVQAVDGDSFKQVGKVGIERDLPSRSLSLMESLAEGARQTYYISAFVLITVEKLIFRDISPKMLGGPIMIAELAGDMARWSFSHLLRFMALFSVNLAILNILPIPILDGGHVVFLLFEKIRGKPISEKVRIRLSQVGLILLLLLMVFVTWNDGLRLFGIY